MGFEKLLGNEHIKANLEMSLEKGHISHFYLISGPEGSGKHTLADLLAAAILCQGAHKPCGSCTPCRKVREKVHPDYITIDDPEKKTVPVDLIREARADIYIQPNESEHKIYLFPRAQDMGLPGQNALLKVLEEPPSYGVFILLTTNADALLPTVRSRCTELRMQPLPGNLLREILEQEYTGVSAEAISAAAERGGGFLGQAKRLLDEDGQVRQETARLVDALCEKDALLLMQLLVPLEKSKRDALAELLQDWQMLLENALTASCGMRTVSDQARRLAAALDSRTLHRQYTLVRKAREYTLGNVSPAAVCGYLEWALR